MTKIACELFEICSCFFGPQSDNRSNGEAKEKDDDIKSELHDVKQLLVRMRIGVVDHDRKAERFEAQVQRNS